MKKIISTIIILIAGLNAEAQKPVIDTGVYGKWQAIGNANISDNGAYFWYNVNDGKQGSKKLVIQATHGSWKQKLTSNGSVVFAADSRELIYMRGKDSLCVLTLKSNKVLSIPNVTEWDISHDARQNWLAYRLATSPKSFILRDLTTGGERLFDHISNYFFCDNQAAIVLEKGSPDHQTTLEWVNINDDKHNVFWKGTNPHDFKFSVDGNRLILTGTIADQPQNIQLWSYEQGDSTATKIQFGEQTVPLKEGAISDIKFSPVGNLLFFTLHKLFIKRKIDSSLASVDVYSYKDAKLQSQQLTEQRQSSFIYVYNFLNDHTIQLEQENERIISPFSGNYVLVRKDDNGDIGNEWNWNKQALSSIYLVSTVDGSRTCICNQTNFAFTYQLSPSGKYVLFYDAVKKEYWTYKIATGVKKNVTKGLRTDWTVEGIENWPTQIFFLNKIIGWTPNDRSILIPSRYEIYQVDPEGKRSPICLTNGYGSKQHLTFENGSGSASDAVIVPGKAVLLHFVDEDSKDEGFCQIYPGRQKNPEMLSDFHKRYQQTTYVRRAKDTALYIVTLEDETHPDNYYLTANFKSFQPLTDLQPQKGYNWLTSELVTWKTPDGKTTRGVLYKPENFNPKKKYPVIFHYYERMSQNLHKFYYPAYSDGGSIDIPTYVSNGYLVFLPDIHYSLGYPGRSACQTIVSAAKYLSKSHWVDVKHLGLMGHSFGAFETNYIVTHSHLFAAAVSISGVTDFVSGYNGLTGDGSSRQSRYEIGQSRIGATLWQRPRLYIKNSPIFYVDKVSTPVLLMANKLDGSVPYEQGIEFFTALRRLEKKAWLLQYDQGDHMVGPDINQKDISLRTRQFFDYYLKRTSPPKWMVNGISASQKQIDSGYEFDTTGREP